MLNILEHEVKIKLLKGGHLVEVLDDYYYFDWRTQLRWEVLAGFVSDGASIPQLLWSSGVSPLVHKGREAAFVHDVACKEKTRMWQQVHIMYRHCLEDLGVEQPQLGVMATAVYNLGPQWDEHGSDLWAIRRQEWRDSTGEEW